MSMFPVGLFQAQQSLNFIHSKISLKAAGDNAVIGNSAVSPEVVRISCSSSFLGQLPCGRFEEQTCARPVFGSKLCFHVLAGTDSGIRCFLLTPYVAQGKHSSCSASIKENGSFTCPGVIGGNNQVPWEYLEGEGSFGTQSEPGV